MSAKTVCSFAAAAPLAGMAPAAAATLSFAGTLANDDAVQRFDFAVAAGSLVTSHSFSCAGGTQGNGTIVSAGGFDPIPALSYVTTGALIDEQDDADSSSVPSDAANSST